MDHRHLNTTEFELDAIDNIIENGTFEDWIPLIEEIDRNPHGEVADDVLHVCKHHPVYGGSAFFKNAIAVARGDVDNTPSPGTLNSKPNSWFN